MTDLLTTPASTLPSVQPSPVSPVREPYLTPRLQPLGQWSAVTLVISVPIGPGSSVFKDWSKF